MLLHTEISQRSGHAKARELLVLNEQPLLDKALECRMLTYAHIGSQGTGGQTLQHFV